MTDEPEPIPDPKQDREAAWEWLEEIEMISG